MTEQMDGQVSWLDQGTWFGKTYQEHFRVQEKDTQEKTFKPSSRKSSASQSQMLPLCLCLTKENGAKADSSTMSWQNGLWLGKFTIHSGGAFRNGEKDWLWLQTSTDSQPEKFCLTLNIGEKPREENPTHLSEILQDKTNEKYNLSEKACIGILRRAEKRGKALPPILKEALENQISDSKELYSQN